MSLTEILTEVNETLGSQDATPKDLEEIGKLRTEGRSLGGAICTLMLNNAKDSFSRLGARVLDEDKPELDRQGVLNRLAVITHYMFIPQIFLRAEETIRSGEPPVVSPSRDKLSDAIVETLGSPANKLQDAAQQLLGEIGVAWSDARNAQLLRESTSPELVDFIAKDILNRMSPRAQRALDDDNITTKKSLVMALWGVLESKQRFHELYNGLA